MIQELGLNTEVSRITSEQLDELLDLGLPKVVDLLNKASFSGAPLRAAHYPETRGDSLYLPHLSSDDEAILKSSSWMYPHSIELALPHKMVELRAELGLPVKDSINLRTVWQLLQPQHLVIASHFVTMGHCGGKCCPKYRATSEVSTRILGESNRVTKLSYLIQPVPVPAEGNS